MGCILRQRPIGKMRPNIVLYSEVHPQGDDISQIVKYDLGKKPDMLIVMGTTLSIKNLKEYTRLFSREVHSRQGLVVLINKEELGAKAWVENVFDYTVLGDVDEWVMKAAHHWKEKNPWDWHKDQEVEPRVHTRYELMEEKPPV